ADLRTHGAGGAFHCGFDHALTSSPAACATSAATLALQGLTLSWESARGLFRFEPLHTDDFAVT
ncbi:MAG: hypothetical protein IV084_06285, partial [Rugosibacter sp.]|nr:hypothetical protein [Rugosibacter sp.]